MASYETTNYEPFTVNNLNDEFADTRKKIEVDMLLFDPKSELHLCGYKSQFFIADCEGDIQRRMGLKFFDSLADAMIMWHMMLLVGRLGVE